MALRINAPWVRYGATAAIFFCLVWESTAQQFADAQVKSYPIQHARASELEQTLRQFLVQRGAVDASIEVFSDPQTNRILVRGGPNVHRAVAQFIPVVDRVAEPESLPLVQAAARTVKPYRVVNVAELQQRESELRKLFANRSDVRIAADPRTRQIIVHAPPEVHDQITAWLQQSTEPTAPSAAPKNALPPGFGAPAQPVRQSAPPARPRMENPTAVNSSQIQLQHIGWRGLLQSMRGIQGVNPAITSPREGHLHMTLPSDSGLPVRLQIDQQNQVVQISGDQDSAQEWTRVVQALDQRPIQQGELQATGRLGDAKPDTITQTIAMLGGAGGAGGNGQALRTIGQNRAGWGGDVVNQMFRPQRDPVQLAQAPQVAPTDAGGAPSDNATAVLGTGDEGGNFLGPVRIEFLEGTDIFIIRGAQRDLDRVMKIINEIENLTKETEPSIEVYQLDHANSEAVAALINELNAGVLEARQGDVNVTALVKPNAVLLIGRPAGVTEVKKLIEQLDVPAEASARFRVFPLEHLPAVDAERTINFLYGQQQNQTQQNTTAGATLTPRVRAVADFRSNSIVVQGSPRDLEEIEDLLKQIDKKDGTSANEVRVFPLKNAIAEEIAAVLDETLGTDNSQQAQQGRNNTGQQSNNTQNANTQAFSSRRAMTLRMKVLDEKTNQLLDSNVLESGILSNVVVTFNERTNTVVVTAPAASMELIAEIIRQLDERPAQEAEIRVITIINGDAQTLVDMLETVFPQDDQQDGPIVQSAAGQTENTLVPLRFGLDPRTNSIIVTGNQADLGVVEAILLKLDANDVNRRKTFVYELLNQQATVVADAITQYVLQKRDAITSIAPDTLSTYDLIDQEIVVVGEDFSNKVIVSVSDRYYDEVMQLLRDLDKRPDMVMVKCLIAEVDLGSTEEWGVELGIQDSLLFNRSVVTGGVPVPGFAFNNAPLGGNSTALGAARDQVAGQALSHFGLGRTNSELGYGGLVLSASNESVSVLLRALQEARRLDILSRPQVMMLNNQPGEVQVGASVPFIGDTITNGLTTTNSVEFLPVGLILSVVPRISPDGLVVLDVLADKSELGSIEDGIPISIAASGDVLRQPQINRTRAETIVSARDGQTVILGGLITKDRAAFERKVPYLADIPLLGKLFRTEGVSESRKELLIILTPHIVRDETDINRINSEEYARMSWCLGNVLETHGDIGPRDPLAEMFEEEIVYSQFAPEGQPVPNGQRVIDSLPLPEGGTQVMPQGTPTPAATPMVLPEGIQPSPTSVSPPLPNVMPAGEPQAGMQLNAPVQQQRTARSTTISRVSAEESNGSDQIRRLGDAPTDGNKTRRAMFRFEEIPTFGISK